MSYINFDKLQLVNLAYSLQKELLRTNRAGSYASTTIVRCNTRKYHGLLVSLQPQIDKLHHVFLSTLDVTVIQQNTEFNLGIHQYGDDLYEPGGHKYIRDFESDPIPKLTYRVGGVVLTAEMVFAKDDDRILIRYTLVDAHSPTKLKFKPLLAFRSIHSLTLKNDNVDQSFFPVKNGIGIRMYQPYDPVYMQFSKKVNYTHNPDWFYGIEYTKEKTRGYDHKEDLYQPGFFEVPLKKGESVIFSAGLNDIGEMSLKSRFQQEVKNRIPRDNFIHCLENAAEQFFMHTGTETDLIAGFHWYNVYGRDTFLALPGLTLTRNDTEAFFDVLDTMVKRMNGVFFPNVREGDHWNYDSVDTSLWFFWTLQQYFQHTSDSGMIWKKYGKLMKKILDAYRDGTNHRIFMAENGLLHAGEENKALTWMNSVVDGIPVVDRNGFAVEINALWYNAISFYIELSQKHKAQNVTKTWRPIIEKINHSFTAVFYDAKNEYLADVVRDDFKDFAVRPNQLFAVTLPYSPLPDEIKYQVLHKVKQELLTPKGIRTLSPKNPYYKGIYKGDIKARDRAYHQGTAFPWLLGHFAEAFLKLHGASGYTFIKNILNEFEAEMTETGIGTVSELFYGDPPQKGKGAISYAGSVAALLRINYLLNKFETNTNQSK